MIETFNSIEEAKFKKVDAYWAARMGITLMRAYPGHGWEVEVDSFQGIAKIFNRHMSPIQGYILKLKEIELATIDKRIVRIGGEILERFGLSREVFEADKIRQIQQDTMGNAKADMS